MEDKEYSKLEDEALNIVSTLNKLKKELESYKEAKLNTEKSLKELDKLVDALSAATMELNEAADKLSSVAEAVETSDYVGIADDLRNQTEQLLSTCASLSKETKSLPKTIDKALESSAAREEASIDGLIEMVERYSESNSNRYRALEQRFSEIEATIGRIDRNTQKGIGKEKG